MTRSVAEIVGWRHLYDVDDAVEVWGTPRGDRYVVVGVTPYTADDLLAWLREQVRDEKWNTEGGVSMAVTDEGAFVGWFNADGADGVEAPTLLAALEQAVRSVAGGE